MAQKYVWKRVLLATMGLLLLGAELGSAAAARDCQTDADCGIGFRCTEQIGMACSGMGSSGSPGVAPVSHEECHVSRGTFACELNQTKCNLDTDCAAGLYCQQSDTNFCYQTTCKVDAACAAGLRCQQSDVSFCWTSLTPSSNPDVALAVDTCTASPPVLCAPRSYFGVRDANLPDGGAAFSDDNAVTGAGGGAPDAPTALSGHDTGATDAGARTEPGGGDGCSLRPRPRPARTELSSVALLGLLVFRRRSRAGR